MKQYHRESKQWLDEEEYERKTAKSKACKKGREHDWVEVLPYGVEATDKYEGSPELYYEAEKAIYEFTQEKYKELADKGILVRCGSMRHLRNFRTYMCSICYKKKYK